MATRRVALVVPGLVTSGGVPAVAAFLYRIIASSNRYEPHLVSLPMSSQDKTSLRLLSPRSWLGGVGVGKGIWNNWPYQHIGAVAAELEFQRYQPRRVLTDILANYDLVQVIAGTPAWAFTTRNLHKPIFLQVATLTTVERQALLEQVSWPRHLWIKGMNRIISQIETNALKHLRAVFVENEWMYEHLSSKMDPTKVIFAPPGIDTTRFRPDNYQPNGYILAVGRLGDVRKNVALLFKAYHRLRQIFPSAPKLVLAGKSMPESSAWQIADSLGITPYIECRLNVTETELAELYQNAAFFVLSSDEEGLGIVILEAMASGIPVVATRCGGPETAVREGETGFLVATGDPEMLAHRMSQLLKNPVEAEAMGKAGRKIAEQHFSLEAAGRAFLQQYDHAFS
ncbi:MAG: glycosyltransferase family 1 protein [Caldilinea sp. CFX5]|nr:glycosyltransferase family 1 protein [Caldilinea sp. CFX5]